MTEVRRPADDLAIRGKPAGTRQFSKRALAVLLGGSALLIFGSLAIAMRPAKSHAAQTKELYSTANKPTADGLAGLPVSYADLPAEVPQLGPPLPGDLGAPILRAQREGRIVFDDRLANALSEPSDMARLRAEAEAAEIKSVRASQLFFTNSASGIDVRPDPAPPGRAPTAAAADPYAILNALGPGGAAFGQGDPSSPTRKEAFADEPAGTGIYNPHRLESPASPWQVMAGTVIPATLVTAVNSDLPGQVIAQVTEPVYDTVTGNTVLIPQGTRVMGRYDSVVAYGQSRALIVWHRIIMPDGTSIQIDNLPAVDGRGNAGLTDRVNTQSLRLFSAAALSSLISIGAELGEDDDDRIARALRDAVQEGSTRVGEDIVRRQLAVQPTLTIRRGWRLSILVHQDIILQPYGDH